MLTVLEPVELAERCFLTEVLYWLAFRRLPLAQYVDDNEEDERFSSWNRFRATDVLRLEVTDAECDFAGLSPNPEHGHEGLEEVETYDAMLACDLREDQRKWYEGFRAEAAALKPMMESWRELIEIYCAYFKSRIFVDLREGKISASGIEFKAKNQDEAIKYIDDNEIDLSECTVVNIPADLWATSKIDWQNSVILGNDTLFCWVHFTTDDMLAAYAIPSDPSIGKLIRLSDLYVSVTSEEAEPNAYVRRGRPSLPWDRFHLEVAVLVRAGSLPKKKEAAIQHFQEWFRTELGISVGRSSIGQKLTPYYHRFLNSKPENPPG